MFSLLLLVFAATLAQPLPTRQGQCVSETDLTSNGFGVSETLIDSPLRRVYWGGGDDSQLLFVVSQNGALYRSTDDAKSFSKVELSFAGSDRAVEVDQVWSSDVDASRYVVNERGGPHFWSSVDSGATWNFTDSIHNATYPVLQSLFMHPENSNVMAAIGWTSQCVDCDQLMSTYHANLYLTNDFGKNWQLIEEYVEANSVAFVDSGKDVHNALMYASFWRKANVNAFDGCRSNCSAEIVHFEPENGQILYRESLYAAVDVFLEIRWSGTVSHVGDNFAIALRRQSPNTGGTILSISHDDGLTWKDSNFPFKDDVQVHYSIVAATESTGEIVTARPETNAFGSNSRWTTLFASRAPGSEEFVQILPFVRMSYGGALWGFSDVELAQGINGVMLANAYRELPGRSFAADGSAALDDSCLETRITADFGGFWGRPVAPQNLCPTEDKCFLQLTGPASSLGYHRFYSVNGALGIWFAPGHVGQCYNETMPQEELDLFFSNNAGETWDIVGSGDWTYEIAAHGSFLIVSETGKNTTTDVKYSLTEGNDWHTCNVTQLDQPLIIDNIETRVTYDQSDFGRHSFLLYGQRGEQGVLMGLDFTSTWTRNCTGHESPRDVNSDYELWSPWTDTPEIPKCELGQVITYVRRKTNVTCDNSYERELIADSYPCSCTENDFVCNYCYGKNSEGECEAIGSNFCIEYFMELRRCPSVSQTMVTLPPATIKEANNKCNDDNDVATQGQVVECVPVATFAGETTVETTTTSTTPQPTEDGGFLPDSYCTSKSCYDCIDDDLCRWCATALDGEGYIDFTKGSCEKIGSNSVQDSLTCSTAAAAAARETAQCQRRIAEYDPNYGCQDISVAARCRKQCGSEVYVRGCECETGIAICSDAACNVIARQSCDEFCQQRGGVRNCDCGSYNSGQGSVIATCNTGDIVVMPPHDDFHGLHVFLIILAVVAVLGVVACLVAIVISRNKSSFHQI